MEFKSRLIVGSGKYKDLEATRDATLASGAEIITVAVRRVNMMDKDSPNIMDYFEGTGIQFLPNSAGCKTAIEAVNLFNMVREGIGIDFVKLEVIGDTEKTLYPDMVETLEAAKMLARDGFKVLCYTNDDPVMAKKLEDAGVSAIMPLASPIGSGLGIQNRYNVLFVKEAVSVPVIVDAGVGCASDATIAMELGADGVLTNSAIALAQDPVKMATAMKMAVEAGRASYEAGRMEKKLFATPSSPTDHMPNL